MAKPVPMPETVRVGVHPYSVFRKTGSELGDNLGHCDVNTLEVWVRIRLRKTKAQEILWHELTHALTPQPVMGEIRYTDEEFIDPLAPKQLQLLRDNPDLVAYLLS